VKNLTIPVILLAGLPIASVQAAPALQDCERIFQQSARQTQLAENVRVRAYAVSGAPAYCAFGKTEAMPALARIVADKRAIRSNSCWTPADEARFQRILVIQKNIVRSIAAACVAARNPGAAQARYPSRTTRD